MKCLSEEDEQVLQHIRKIDFSCRVILSLRISIASKKKRGSKKDDPDSKISKK